MNDDFAASRNTARIELARAQDFQLGGVSVRPSLCEVEGSGWVETLEPRVMQVLVALARKQGRLVSRDDLIESCWSGRLVGEDSISRCIARLRKLAETSQGAFAIDTVLRVGYRLRSSAPAASRIESASPGEPTAPTRASRTSIQRSVWRRFAIPAAGVTILMAAAATWWLLRESGSSGPPFSVAILPFANTSGDPKKDYLSEGFSEELIDDLSNDPHLHVSASSSSFAFKVKDGDIQSIARALHVSAIVEGSVRAAAGRIHVSAQLINAATGYNIWSAHYDRTLADVLMVQDELARGITTALTHQVAPLPPHRAIDPAIYELYLDGVRQMRSLSPDGSQRAFAIFKQVTVKQPDFADGFSALASATLQLAPRDIARWAPYLAADNEAALKALALDPHNRRAWMERMKVDLYSANWDGAAKDYRALQRENPNERHVLYGLNQYYAYLGFPEEAIVFMRRAIAVEPMADDLKLLALEDVLPDGRYAEAIEFALTVSKHQPNSIWPWTGLCAGYAGAKRFDEARRAEHQLLRLHADSDFVSQCEFNIDSADGNHAQAHNLVDQLAAGFPDKQFSADDIAEDYVRISDFDKATEWFRRAYDRREAWLFRDKYWNGGARYFTTAGWKTLTQQPLFKVWQAEHDRIAAALAAHRDSLN